MLGWFPKFYPVLSSEVSPKDHLMTDSGPLNIPSVFLGPFRTLQGPSGPIRTHQDPSGPFEPFMIPYYNFINLLKDNIFCRKMLVFDLNAFSSLINISAYIALRNKIKDSLRIYIDRAVQKYIKLLL